MTYLGEYMLNVKNKKMNSLKEEIECSKARANIIHWSEVLTPPALPSIFFFLFLFFLFFIFFGEVPKYLLASYSEFSLNVPYTKSYVRPCSKGHLLYLIDVHIFSKEDINLNTTTLAWPQKIKPVFEQNTEIVEDCKARYIH